MRPLLLPLLLLAAASSAAAKHPLEGERVRQLAAPIFVRSCCQAGASR